MAKDTNNPAAQSFSTMVTEWERNFDAFANQVMGTEAYSQAMNEMQKAQLGYQRGFAEMMTQQLSSMNMPSREDVLQLTDMVRQLDRRMERIEERLAVSGGGAKTAAAKKSPRPKRTKQPPAADAQ